MAQSGGIMVEAYVNSTNNLKDNSRMDTLCVRLMNRNIPIDTVNCFTTSIDSRIPLKPGNYDLVLESENRKIYLYNFLVYSDQITFINLLIEPTKKMNLVEQLKRKRSYHNYRKVHLKDK